MLRRVTVGVGLLVLGCCLVPLLSWGSPGPRRGMVVTKDTPPQIFIGDVDEAATPGHVDVKSADNKTRSFDNRNVDKVTYFTSPADEFASRVSVLDHKDVAARVDLANFAVANAMYPEARQLLVEVLTIDPANRNALDMLKQVEAKIKAANPPPTQPAAAPPPPADEQPARIGLVRARRTLTPDEINFIRQNEWTENDRNMRVQVTHEGIKAAHDLGLIDSDALRNMSPAEIGWQIVQHGPPGLRKEVKVGNDPGLMLTYRMQVHKVVIASCATGACHNTDKGGSFFLFSDPPLSDATVDSDYLILQQYAKTIKGTEYSMIDRLHPENSLLTQFALPPALATIPHPKALGYVPPAKPPFTLKQVQAWIGSLPAVPPPYLIDLSKPPPTTKPVAPQAH